MSINNNKREGKKTSFAGSLGLGVFIITSILLAGSGFALVGSTTTPMTTAFAQEGNNTTADSTPSSNTTATTTTADTSSGIQLSPQPVIQEDTTTTSTIPINQTHISATFSGNGTVTLPNTSDTINYTTNGTAVIALETHSVLAEETLMTEQGETATATFYEIAKFDPARVGEGKGLTMALIETTSTGALAPLNGTIVAGISDMQPNGETSVILWEWESGVGNN
jgi:cytoskeletal protein RodZ